MSEMAIDQGQSEVRLSREDLHALIWSEPMIRLAERFRITNFALSKICRDHAVPVPPVGYWQKLAYNKAPPKIPLPPAPDGISETIVISASAPKPKPKPKAKPPKATAGPPPPSTVDEPGVEPIEAVGASTDPAVAEVALPLPDKVARLHPLVSATKEGLMRSLIGPGTTGFAYAYGVDALNVRGLGPASVDRACRILHVVIKELERRGHKVIVEKGESYVQIGAEKVKFRMEEKKETTPHKPTAEEIARQKRDSWFKPPKTDSWPTGNLIIRVEEYVQAPRKSWSDGKRTSLDTMLIEVVDGIEAVGEALRIQTEERERERREWAEQERRRWIMAQWQREEDKRFEALVQASEAWDLGRKLDAYANAVEANAQAHGHADHPDIRRWIDWARRRAAELDPTRKGLPIRKVEWDEPPKFD